MSDRRLSCALFLWLCSSDLAALPEWMEDQLSDVVASVKAKILGEFSEPRYFASHSLGCRNSPDVVFMVQLNGGLGNIHIFIELCA